ncbi:hypothetical protein ACRE_054290 [Hapsidospora chrysogenum ATCC 11550]|uniref:5'-3' DNA helicase ZGRF1-like N-terminal domain-containing protein n=1 Tax=Hapsidospora chrysogenum (strain ATCC 11550 / CBS 779.69 / DSM 880 / IAM 14645 / JCM 23072 / IMI 49137) TaxID=857340 RepID=A0A086T367_HAPC1|nr:hypothetical protein ACRE_054290 [Hapsidospora chrysogenum ATCC 11550]
MRPHFNGLFVIGTLHLSSLASRIAQVALANFSDHPASGRSTPTQAYHTRRYAPSTSQPSAVSAAARAFTDSTASGREASEASPSSSSSSQPISIDIPRAKKSTSAPVYTPPEPLSARGDLPGYAILLCAASTTQLTGAPRGYFPMHEDPKQRVHRPHPFNETKARNHLVTDLDGTVRNRRPIDHPKTTGAMGTANIPVTSYFPTGYQDNALPMGKYYPSNYESAHKQGSTPSSASVASPADPRSPALSSLSNPSQPAGSDSEVRRKMQLQQYQRDMMAQASRAANEVLGSAEDKNEIYKTTPATTTTTSSVYEYICLFTHDLKRKTKRWQDGRLRYHAFNGRIMVYDDRGGVVGDAHLATSSQSLDEGEELTLDRGAAIVQVCERVGEKQVDLGELVDRRAREVEKRRREASAKQQRARPRAPREGPDGDGPLHRPLSAIMNTPGRIGRAAIPRESPYEQRQQSMRQQQEQDDTPAAKRRKTNASPPAKMTHARSLFGTQLTLSATPMSSWSRRSQALRDKTNVRLQIAASVEKDPKESAMVPDDLSEQRGVSLGREMLSPQDKPLGMVPRVTTGNDKNSIIRQGGGPERSLKSRLGSLRVSRGNEEEAETDVEPVPDTYGAETRRRKNTLSASRDSGPEIVSIDSSMEETSVSTKPTKLRPKSSLIRGQTSTAVTRADVQKSLRKAHCGPDGDESQVVQKGKQGLSRAPPAAIQRQKSTDRARDSSDTSPPNDEPPREGGVREPEVKGAQPRAELHIKARKKRGLLMLSERKSASDEDAGRPPERETPAHAEDEAGDFEEWYAKGILSDGNTNADGDPPQFGPVPAVPDDSCRDVAQETDRVVDMDGSQGLRELSSKSPEGPGTGKVDQEEGDAVVTQPTELPDPLSRSPQRLDRMSDDSDSDAPRTRLRRKQERKPNQLPSAIPEWAYDQSQSEDDWTGPVPATTLIRQAKKTPTAKLQAPDKQHPKTGPRISRINKSSKSKEIFGWKPPVEDLIVPNALATAVCRIGWGPSTVTPAPTKMETKTTQESSQNGIPTQQEGICKIKEDIDGSTTPRPATHQDDSSPGVPQDSRNQKRTAHQLKETGSKSAAIDESAGSSIGPRIANPATRGKKAASKADAAGRAPQNVVPVDPVNLTRAKPPETAGGSASLPGFSKANGGAWSRHAHDLLGIDRPKRR